MGEGNRDLHSMELFGKPASELDIGDADILDEYIRDLENQKFESAMMIVTDRTGNEVVSTKVLHDVVVHPGMPSTVDPDGNI